MSSCNQIVFHLSITASHETSPQENLAHHGSPNASRGRGRGVQNGRGHGRGLENGFTPTILVLTLATNTHHDLIPTTVVKSAMVLVTLTCFVINATLKPELLPLT